MKIEKNACGDGEKNNEQVEGEKTWLICLAYCTQMLRKELGNFSPVAKHLGQTTQKLKNGTK